MNYELENEELEMNLHNRGGIWNLIKSECESHSLCLGQAYLFDDSLVHFKFLHCAFYVYEVVNDFIELYRIIIK